MKDKHYPRKSWLDFHIRGRSRILIRDMRKQPAKAAHSEEANSAPELMKVLRDFEAAPNPPELADELQAIRERLSKLEMAVFETSAPASKSPPQKPRRGRKPKLDWQEVLERRNHLVVFLEQNWPYLSVGLHKAKKPRNASGAIAAAKSRIPGVFQPPFYEDPIKHEEALWDFLRSGRFYGNPRNLAGAMAGLPELSWKRSFDICSHHPCKQPIAQPAIWDYMRRNFYDRWRELQSARTPEQVKVILAKSPTQDPTYLHLKEHPGEALEWLNAGRPASERVPRQW